MRNVNEVFLNGGGVPGEATSDVCPSTTTTYTLRVQTLTGGTEERNITINVTPPTPTFTPLPPADMSGPSIKPSASPNPASYGGSCSGGTVVSLNAFVSDPSGISNVQIWYRYESGGTIGGWWSLPVTDSGGDNYSASLDNNAGNQAYNTLGGIDGYVRWYVLATDRASNTANSGDQLVTLQYCIG